MTHALGRTSAAQQSDLAQRLTTQLAAELRELRRRTGKSLRELERPTLSSDSSLSRYLAGRSLPPWQVVEVLSEQGGGDSAHLHVLWSRARQAKAEARIGDPTPQSTVAPEPPARRTRVRWLVAAAALAGVGVGVVGLIARRHLIRA